MRYVVGLAHIVPSLKAGWLTMVDRQIRFRYLCKFKYDKGTRYPEVPYKTKFPYFCWLSLKAGPNSFGRVLVASSPYSPGTVSSCVI